jgi:serine/threonine protein kinase
MNSSIIGQVFFGRYRVDRFIASGEMGDIYRAWDMGRDVPLTMKVLHRSLVDDASVWEHFRREASALQELAHPNIVPFYGVYQTGEIAFLLNGYVEGFTLKDIMWGQTTPIAVEEALTCIKAVSAALDYAHRLGIVHCDVKPGNVMIDREGRVYLSDFGTAHHAESMATIAFVRESAADYLSPEQCRGDPVTPATDIYAMGVMLYEMVAGVHPFQGSKGEGDAAANNLRYAQRNLAPPDPRQYNPGIPQPLAGVILRAMAKNPGDRFRGAQEFYEAACAASGIASSSVPDWLDLSGTLYAPAVPPSSYQTGPAPARYQPPTVPAPYQPPTVPAPQEAWPPPPPYYAPAPQQARPPAAPGGGKRRWSTGCIAAAILGAVLVCGVAIVAAVVIGRRTIFGPTSTPGLVNAPALTQTAMSTEVIMPGETVMPGETTMPGEAASTATSTETPTPTLTPTRTPSPPTSTPTITLTNTLPPGSGGCGAYCVVNGDCQSGLVCWSGICWDDCICEGRSCPMP